MAGDEYAICANVCEPDRCLRMGARVWVEVVSGGAPERAQVIGWSRSGRRIEKIAAIHRLRNFRAKWVPEPLRSLVFFLRSKEKAEQRAAELERIAEDERAEHPGRRV